MRLVRFPTPGDDVTVHIGGSCGITLKGHVAELVMDGGRQGMVITDSRGKRLTLYYEELDDFKVEESAAS